MGGLGFCHNKPVFSQETEVQKTVTQGEEPTAKQAGIQKLDGKTRAKVLAALAGLVILGFGMVLLTWLGARVTQRYMRGSAKTKLPTVRPPDDDWAKKPLAKGNASGLEKNEGK